MYEKREEQSNMIVNIKLIDVDRFNKKFDPEEIKDTVNEIPWDIISFPICCARRVIDDDPTAKGNLTIGYVNGYDTETKEFTITVFSKFIDIVSSFTNTVINPVGIKNSNDRFVITRMIIGPEESFEYLSRNRKSNNNRPKNGGKK